jgi:O-antigen/teichoic acid export membrane protein
MMENPSQSEGRAVTTLGRGSVIVTLGTVLLVVLTFAGRVLVARTVSLPEWGAYNLGLAFTSILATVALLGLPNAIARTLAYESDPAVQRRTIEVGTILAVTSSIVVSVALYFLAVPLAARFEAGATGPLALTLQVFSFTVGLILLTTFLAAVFQGFERVGPQAWFNNVLTPLMFLVFLVIFLSLRSGFLGILVSYLLACLVAFLGAMVYTFVKLPSLIPKVPTAGAALPAQLWPLTVGLWGVNSLYLVTAWLDTLVLGFYRNSTTVGYYSSAISLARVLIVGNAALLFVYLPVATRLIREQNHSALRSTFATTTRWSVAIAFPFLLLFIFFPSLSLSAVFGSRYSSAGFALQILTVGAFLTALTGPSAALLAAQARSRALLIISVISAVLSAAIAFAFIPSTGSVGASIAWTGSRIAFVGLGLGLVYQSDRINPLGRDLMLPLGISLVVGCPLFYALSRYALPNWSVVPLFFVGLFLFVGAVLLTRSLSRADLEAIGGVSRALRVPSASIERFLSPFTKPSSPPADSVRLPEGPIP